MLVDEIVEELRGLGNASTKKTWLRHGASEPIFGVKIEDLKKIRKRIKTDQQLALDLYATGNADAMYLAGLIADDSLMSRADLQRWLKQANWHMISDCTVAWVAAGSRFGVDLARKWIDSKDVKTASAGWSTWCSLVAVKDDSELDLHELEQLITRVANTIHDQPDRVRYNMNNFIIAVGSHVRSLNTAAKKAAKKIGTVQVDMGDTACKVPAAFDYIEYVEKRGNLGKKRKTAKCV